MVKLMRHANENEVVQVVQSLGLHRINKQYIIRQSTGYTSINSPSVTVLRTSASDRIQIQPNSSVLQIKKSLVNYPVQIGRFGRNFSWYDDNFFVAEGQAHHYTQDRHHYLPNSVFINKQELADYTYGISSAMFWRPILKLNLTDLEQLELTKQKWYHINNVMNNVSIMSLHTNDSEAHIQLDIHYATPTSSEYADICLPDTYLIYCERHEMTLKRFSTLRFVSLVTFMYRYITVRKLPPGKFDLTLDINLFFPLMEVITYKDYHDTFNYGLKDYFVIWQSRKISWNAANQTCASIGGSSIKGSSQEDIGLVERLPPLPSPVRFHPHTGVFIDQVYKFSNIPGTCRDYLTVFSCFHQLG